VRKSTVGVCLFFCVLGLVFAQNDEPKILGPNSQANTEAGARNDENRGEGLIVSLNMAVDAFNTTAKTFENPEIRGPSAQNATETQFFISNWEFAKDANASIGYDGKNFGGNFAFVPQAGASWTFGAAIRGWAQFSFLRVVLGNDIETLYADRQGSDEALAVYTVKGIKRDYVWDDPDNITDSNGLLVRAFLQNLTIDLAAGDFSYKRKATERIEGSTNENIYKDRFDVSYRYGARIGYELEGLGKINASYKIYQKQNAVSYNTKGGNSDEIVPFFADAQFFDHTFGLYGSFKFNNFSFTAGYVGAATSYLPKFYTSAIGGAVEVDTALPFILRNGVVFNAMLKGDGFTFRTDNGFTFWQDKNYDIFGTTQSNWDMNLVRKEIAEPYAFVNHVIMRNGFGLSFPLTGGLEGGVYLFNSFIMYSASGSTTRGAGVSSSRSMEYVLWEDELRLELKLSYSFNPNASAFITLKLSDAMSSRSKDLNEQSIGFFVNKVHGNTPEPVATLDNTFAVNIPVGISLRLR